MGMDSFHIAVLSPVAQMGGAEISLVELVRRLEGNPRLTLILPEDGPLRREASGAGARVCILPWPDRVMRFGERMCAPSIGESALMAGMIPRLTRRLSRLLQEIRADGLITNGIKAHLVGAAARRAGGLPLLWYLRDGLEGRRLSSILLRLYSSRCCGAIAISRYVEGEWRRVLPPAVAVRVLYNIVDLEKYRPGGPVPSDLRKSPGEIWYGMIGAITPLKGQDLFLEAAKGVIEAVPEARFLIVGANSYRAEASMQFEADLRRRVQEIGIQERVRFLGHRNDVAGILSTLDVLVQPNRGPEGLGRSILEAMASAVPVIAVNRWGPSEIIKDGETGLLTPWMDVEALTNRMRLLGREATLRARLGANGRDWMMRNLQPDKLVAQFREILGSMMQTNGKG